MVSPNATEEVSAHLSTAWRASRIFWCPCSGRGSREEPRGSRRPSAVDLAAEIGGRNDEPGRAEAALHGARPRTPPAPDAARRPPRGPRRSQPRARPPERRAPRQERTRVPSRSTEHDPHSPCSHAFFEPGSSEPIAQLVRRLSPAQTFGLPPSPLTVSSTLTRGTPSSARCVRTRARGDGRPRCRGRRRSVPPRLRPARGTCCASSSGPRDSQDGPGGAERGAELTALAVRHQRERADCDDHRVPRADLHERLRCTARAGRRPRTMSSSSASAFRFAPSENSSSGRRADASEARELDLAALDEEQGERVPRGRGRAEVAADRPRLRICGDPTVREALGECREIPRATRSPPYVSPAPSRSAVHSGPSAKLADLVQVQELRPGRRDRS